MKFAIGYFTPRNLLNSDWWKCNFRYLRGLIRYIRQKYQASVDDFQWILNNRTFARVDYLLYENIGINYVRLKDFNKAEEYLLKAKDHKAQQQNGYLFMWLGYVYLVKKRYEESLACFRTARQLSQKGYYKWLVDHNYVERQIEQLQEDIRGKYNAILRNN
jgi:tetratricopeptide (TPR) repeat protein